MENRTVLETSRFVSRSAEPKAKAAVSSRRRSKENKSHDSFGAGFLVARLGVCALLLCGVIAVKLAGDTKTLEAVSAYTEPNATESEERLGRLKFVDLPSVIDVFAPSRAAVLPAKCEGFELKNDGFDLELLVEPGEEAVSPASGKVSEIGADDNLGRFVSIAASDDTVFTVYGLKELCVEAGQPVRQRARLGAAEGERLIVRITRAGRPIEPAEYFGLGASG